MAVKLFSSRNLRYGLVSVGITAAVIAVIVLLNVVLTTIFKKYPLNIDLTRERMFEISKETKDFLTSLDDDVNIYVLNTESRFTSGGQVGYFVQANEVIHKYPQYSSRVHLEYVDLIRNPDFTSRFPGSNAELNDILIVAGEKFRVLKPQDIFNIRTKNDNYYYPVSYIASSKAEQALTSALLAITSKKNSLAAVVTGHGEEDVSAFTDLLKLNAWNVQTFNSLTEPIPQDADMLILSAPTRDLSTAEMKAIDDFLESGKDRVLFYLGSLGQSIQSGEENQSSLKNIDAFLAEWGLAVDPGIVFETNSSRIVGDPYTFLADFVEDDYSKSVVEQRLPPVLPLSRPLRIIFEGARYRTTKVLIQTSPSSGIRPADASLDWQPGDRDLASNIPLLALSTSSRNNVDGDIVSAHVVACGSVLAWNPSILEENNFANSAYFLDLLGGLTKRGDQIYIQNKSLLASNLNITESIFWASVLIFIVLIPLAVLGTGIGVWLRRRHK
jgi:hypothetical protein